MRIATYNVNSINARLPVLLRWLNETAPDIVCLQELKAPDEKFPEDAILNAGYQPIWKGQKLEWSGYLSRHEKPQAIISTLPGDPEDLHSRYLEAETNGIIIGSIYLPNGNPAPGPKFDYKLSWIQRFIAHTKTLMNTAKPVILAGDYNIIPGDEDVYKPESWVGDALFRTEVKEAFKQLISTGWTDALRHLYPHETIYTYWDYFRNAFDRNAGLRIDHFLVNPAALSLLKSGGVDVQVRDGKNQRPCAGVD